MQWDVPSGAAAAVHAPILQLVVTLGAAAMLAGLWLRFAKPHFGWWTLAWTLYAIRNAVILAFLITERPLWLFWHQVATGWTAIAFLWAAMVFATGRRPGGIARLVGIAFPLLWSFVAVYRLDNFMLAVVPAVAFLSGATLWTAGVFWRHARRNPSVPAVMLAVGFALWGLHHLDYPVFRAQGLWNPWGYYLDVLFELWTAAGLLLLVQDDLRAGLRSLVGISADVQSASAVGEAQRLLIERPLGLPGVVGAGLFHRDHGFTSGAGFCADWPATPPDSHVLGIVTTLLASGQYGSHDDIAQLVTEAKHVGVLPLGRQPQEEALVLLSNARDPFTALDDRYLEAFGRQLGTALLQVRLRDELSARGKQLERMAIRLARQHEEERARLSRELHDETAQVLAALSLELGTLKESLEPPEAAQAEVALRLVKEGIAGIRTVTDRLRPPLLDDLGLVPALQALVVAYARDAGLDVTFDTPDTPLTTDAERELTLYRALQETLANVARHSGERAARVTLREHDGCAILEVADDGPGLEDLEVVWKGGGLTGLRDRLHRLDGSLSLESRAEAGTTARIVLPLIDRKQLESFRPQTP